MVSFVSLDEFSIDSFMNEVIMVGEFAFEDGLVLHRATKTDEIGSQERNRGTWDFKS